MDTFSLSFAVVFTACFSLGVVYGQGSELEIVKFEEDRTVNLTIYFDQSATELQNDDYYVIEVRTRLSDGKVEYDGRVVRWNNSCTVTYQKSVRCVTKMGPVALYKKINKSHLEIEWSWTWKDNNSGKLKTNKWKKKLQDMYCFDNTTLMEFVTAKMMFAASTVVSLLGYVVAAIVTIPLLLYPFQKWKKGNLRENNQPLEYPLPQNSDEGSILKTFKGTYNQLRRRWRNRVSIPSESNSQETHKEVLPKNEPKEPEVKESPEIFTYNDEKEPDKTQVKPEKMVCTETAKKRLDPAMKEDETGDPAVEEGKRVSSTDRSETIQSKQVPVDSEVDPKENWKDVPSRNKPGEFSFSEPLRFLLVGKTGVGKSSTGNTILGSKLFLTSPGFRSKTTDCETHSMDIEECKVEITDSPGLFDTRLTEDNIAIKIVHAVACLHPGPSAVLFVIRISRFTEEEEATYRQLKAIFDEDVTKHTVIVFTGGDSLSDKVEDIGNMIDEAPTGLKDILKACGERYVVFDNNATDKKSQVTLLLKTVKEMIKRNPVPRYVCHKYVEISKNIENEIQRRLTIAQQKEDEHKLHIKQLNYLNELLLEKNQKTETEFKKREEETKQYLKEQKESVEKIQELEKKLRMRTLSAEDMKKEMEKVVKVNEQLGKELKEMQEKEQKQTEMIVRKANEDIVKIMEEMVKMRFEMDYLTRTDFRNRIAQNKEEGFLRGLINAEFLDIVAGVWKVICSIKN